MTHEEMIEQLENTILLIEQNGKDWMDERDIPILEVAIKAMKMEPCEDTISRQAVLNEIETVCFSKEWSKFRADYGSRGVRDHIINYIEQLTSVQPKPKMGRWILLDECSNSGYYCSECHKKVVKEGWSNTVKKIKYCPNCGAKMEESEDGD